MIDDPLLGGFNGAPRWPEPGPPIFTRLGEEYRFEWRCPPVSLAFTGVRDRSDGPRAELAVTFEGAEIHWGVLTLASTAARETVVKKLAVVAPGVPWRSLLEHACRQTVTTARRGEPLVELSGRVTTPTRELMPRLLYEGEPTMVYADGDTGKSLFALAVAVAVQTGASLPFGLRPTRTAPTAYLDWETGRETIEGRLGLLAAGLGVEPPPVLYKAMARPLVDEAPVLAVEFARRGVRLVVVDSMMFAVASGDGAAFHEPITAFYSALRLFAPAASLVLNHVTNADARGGGPARPFGGAFAFNGPRLIWEAKRDPDVTDATAIAFTCRKANNMARRPDPFGLRFMPGQDTITIYPFDLTEASPQATAGASLPYRVRLALASSDLTAPELADALNVPANVVRTVLGRLKAKGLVVERESAAGKATRWGLA